MNFNTKSRVFFIVSFLTSIPFWFFYRAAIDLGSLESSPAWLTFVFLTITLTSLSILLLFARHRSEFLTSVFAVMAPGLIFFRITPLLLGAMAIMLVLASHALTRVWLEIRSRLTFRISILLRQGLPLILTAFSALLAVVYFTETSASLPQSFSVSSILPQPLFNKALEISQPYLWENMFPGYTPTTTAQVYLKTELEHTGIQVNALSPEYQSQLVNKSLSRLTAESQIEIRRNDTLQDIFYRIVLERSNEFLSAYRTFIPIVFAVTLFLFLRTLAFPYSYILIFIVTGVLKILKHAGVVVQVEEEAIRERLEWNL